MVSSADDLEIISAGSLYRGDWEKKYWSSSRGKDRFPYPVHYCAVRHHAGTKYQMEILEGRRGPLFLVTSNNGESSHGPTPDIAWKNFLNVSKSKVKNWRRLLANVDGNELFGFKNPVVQRLLRELMVASTGTAGNVKAHIAGRGLKTLYCQDGPLSSNVKIKSETKELEPPNVDGRGIFSEENLSSCHAKGFRNSASSCADVNLLTVDDIPLVQSSSQSLNTEIDASPSTSVDIDMGCNNKLNDSSYQEGSHGKILDECAANNSLKSSSPSRSKTLPENVKKACNEKKCCTTEGIQRIPESSATVCDEYMSDLCHETEFSSVTSNPSSGNFDLDSAQQEVAKSMMAFLLPCAIPLPKLSRRRKSKKKRKIALDCPSADINIDMNPVAGSSKIEHKGELPTRFPTKKSEEIISDAVDNVLLHSVQFTNSTSIEKPNDKICYNNGEVSLDDLNTIVPDSSEDESWNEHIAKRRSLRCSMDSNGDVCSKGNCLNIDSKLASGTKDKNSEPSNCLESNAGTGMMNVINDPELDALLSSDSFLDLLDEEFKQYCNGGLQKVHYPAGHMEPFVLEAVKHENVKPSTSTLQCSKNLAKELLDPIHISDNKMTRSVLNQNAAYVSQDYKDPLEERELFKGTNEQPEENFGMKKRKITYTNLRPITNPCMQNEVGKKVVEAEKSVGPSDVLCSQGFLASDFLCEESQLAFVHRVQDYVVPLPESAVHRDVDKCQPTDEVVVSERVEMKDKIKDSSVFAKSPDNVFPSEVIKPHVFNPDEVGIRCIREDGMQQHMGDDRHEDCNYPSVHPIKESANDPNCAGQHHHIFSSRCNIQGALPGEAQSVKEIDGGMELMGCYNHPSPVLSVQLMPIEGSVQISVICGVSRNRERFLYIYTVASEKQIVGQPSFTGYTSMLFPSEEHAEIPTERYALQLTPGVNFLTLLGSVKAPRCRAKCLGCLCSLCKSNCREDNLYIVSVQFGYVSQVTELTTFDKVCCILVCEPNYIIAYLACGELQIWVMTIGWRTQREQFRICGSQQIHSSILELKRIPGYDTLIIGHNGMGVFCTWDVSKRALLNTFEAPSSIVSEIRPIGSSSWKFLCSNSMEGHSKVRRPERWHSGSWERASLKPAEEELVVWLLISSASLSEYQFDLRTKERNARWRLCLLAKNMVFMGNVLDVRPTAVHVLSSNTGLAGTHEGLLYKWELSTGKTLSSMQCCDGGSISCIAADAKSGTLALTDDKCSLHLYTGAKSS